MNVVFTEPVVNRKHHCYLRRNAKEAREGIKVLRDAKGVDHVEVSPDFHYTLRRRVLLFERFVPVASVKVLPERPSGVHA